MRTVSLRSCRWTSLAFAVVVVSLPACRDFGTVPSPAPQRMVSRKLLEASVTPVVARSLGADGKFRITPMNAEPYAQITGDLAGAIALAAARQFGPFVREHLEHDRGAPIDLNGLRLDAVYYATTPYEPAPEDAHPSTQKYYGPYYLVVLVDAANSPTLIVPVSARNTDVVLMPDGKIRLPAKGGSALWLYSIPVRLAATVVTPETAVVEMNEHTGRHAAELPQLILPVAGNSKLLARWRLKMDSPVSVSVRGSNKVRQVDEVYVGMHGDISVPEESQPEASPLQGYGRPRSAVRKAPIPVIFQAVDLTS